MGSVSNSLSSTNVNTSGSTGTTFMGSSTYSKDFQAVIDRAVGIASLPIQVLENQKTDLSNQADQVQALDTQFAKLQTAVQGIATALGGSAFQSEVSQPGAVQVSLGDGAVEGVYTINVNSIGAYGKSLTNQSWNAVPDSTGTAAPYTLMVNGQAYTFTPADNGAASVAAAINAKYSNLVQALAINVGSTNVPDWRISLQSTKLGPAQIDLHGPPPGLQQQLAPVNGYSSSQTAATWDATPDPSGGGATYNLIIGGQSYAIQPADNNIEAWWTRSTIRPWAARSRRRCERRQRRGCRR